MGYCLEDDQRSSRDGEEMFCNDPQMTLVMSHLWRCDGHCGRLSHEHAKKGNRNSFSELPQKARRPSELHPSSPSPSPVSLTLNPKPLKPTPDWAPQPLFATPPLSSSLLLAWGFLNWEHLTWPPPTHVSLCSSIWPWSTLSTCEYCTH